MEIEITIDEWTTAVAGAEVVISADIKVEITVDFRDEDCRIDAIYINAASYSTEEQRRFNDGVCDWRRIDDIPEYDLINKAVNEWVRSDHGFALIWERAQNNKIEVA